MKSVLLCLLFLISFQFFLIQPFFHSGFFPTHDDIQIIRIFEYYQSLKFGGFPPRWSSGLLFGHGYPLFVFYSPMAYFLGALVVVLGFNFLIATKMIFVLSFFIGATGIFFLLRFFAKDFPALIASIIYSLLPYRAVDVYVRGDLSEFFAYSFFPWVVWINLKFIKNYKNKLLLPFFGIFLTILILSHNISILIFGIFLVIFNIFWIFKSEKDFRLILVRKLFCGAILSVLLSCFYWLPLLMESRFVQLDKVIADPYNQYFLSFNQIWYSPWGYGGFLQQSPMSLQLGQVMIVISFLTFILNMFIKSPLKKIIYFFSFSFIVTILLETKFTQFLWDIITPLHYLQFPWRLHILSTICGVVLVGFFFYLLENIKIFQQKTGRFIFFLATLFIIWLSFHESYSFFKAKSFMEAKPAAATTTGEEYLPKWVGSLPSNYSPDKVEFLSNKGKLENIEWGYYLKKFTVINQKESRIKIAHIYYPGWDAFINGKQVNIKYDNKFGQMEISVPKGTNNIIFEFNRTWWRALAEMISVAGFIGTFFLIIKGLSIGKKWSLKDKG